MITERRIKAWNSSTYNSTYRLCCLFLVAYYVCSKFYAITIYPTIFIRNEDIFRHDHLIYAPQQRRQKEQEANPSLVKEDVISASLSHKHQGKKDCIFGFQYLFVSALNYDSSSSSLPIRPTDNNKQGEQHSRRISRTGTRETNSVNRNIKSNLNFHSERKDIAVNRSPRSISANHPQTIGGFRTKLNDLKTRNNHQNENYDQGKSKDPQNMIRRHPLHTPKADFASQAAASNSFSSPSSSSTQVSSTSINPCETNTNHIGLREQASYSSIQESGGSPAPTQTPFHQDQNPNVIYSGKMQNAAPSTIKTHGPTDSTIRSLPAHNIPQAQFQNTPHHQAGLHSNQRKTGVMTGVPNQSNRKELQMNIQISPLQEKDFSNIIYEHQNFRTCVDRKYCFHSCFLISKAGRRKKRRPLRWQYLQYSK